MPSRDPLWYRVWFMDISGELPPLEETEWLRPWMADAKPGDKVYLTWSNRRCVPSEADTVIECDM